jgi:calcium/calmodulin-dependent protein kinase I
MQQQHPPKTCDNIGDYYTITDKELGHGYFAVVNVGVNNFTNEKVAIKIVDKRLVERQETLDNEVEILNSINHCNIVKMEAIFDTVDHLYIVMELMEGGELYDEIIKRKSFTEADASYIMRQVYSALKYLHSRGIVHRDLKLENLLLVRENALDIKIADFGLSRIYSGKKLQTACGTPFYVAPEIVLAEGYGPEVDMWASGIILYVLLSGRLPFAAENENDLYKLIVGGKLIFKSPQFDSVSEAAKDFIRKLIITDPIKRLNAVNALEHPFIKGENIDNETPLHGLCDAETDCFSKGQLMVYKSKSH